VGKIFNELKIEGWCREFEVKNGPGVVPLGDQIVMPTAK
jgi:hypothetical protein